MFNTTNAAPASLEQVQAQIAEHVAGIARRIAEASDAVSLYDAVTALYQTQIKLGKLADAKERTRELLAGLA